MRKVMEYWQEHHAEGQPEEEDDARVWRERGTQAA